MQEDDGDDAMEMDYKKSDHAEPSAKEALEGRLGEIDKLVMLLLANKMSSPPSPLGSPLAGTPPSLPPTGPGGPPPMPMGAMPPPPPPMGAGGPMGAPPMGNPMLQQQLMAARGLV